MTLAVDGRVWWGGALRARLAVLVFLPSPDSNLHSPSFSLNGPSPSPSLHGPSPSPSFHGPSPSPSLHGHSPSPSLGFQVRSSTEQLLVWEIRVSFSSFELEAGFRPCGWDQDCDMGGLVWNQGGLEIIQIQLLEKGKKEEKL